MNRPLTLATAVLAAGAIIIGTTGCSMGGEDTPPPATIETQAPTTVTEQTTVTDQDQNDDNQNDDNQNDNENQNDNQDQNDQAEGEAVGKAAESAGLSEAKKECLANAPSAADCANIP